MTQFDRRKHRARAERIAQQIRNLQDELSVLDDQRLKLLRKMQRQMAKFYRLCEPMLDAYAAKQPDDQWRMPRTNDSEESS